MIGIIRFHLKHLVTPKLVHLMVSLSHIKMFLPVIVHLLMLIFLLQMLIRTPCRMLMNILVLVVIGNVHLHIKMDWIQK